MKYIHGGICVAKGFLSAGIYAGIKRQPNKRDIALIYSQSPCVAAGVFTKNLVKAAPIKVTETHLKLCSPQAIIINSGNANACTGEQGYRDAMLMASLTASALNLPTEAVAVASTGVIGVTLPMEKITAGIVMAVSELSHEDDTAAMAIMTTDTFTKKVAIECEIAGKIVTIGGMAKGSGMIHPNMATMLGFITTDAAISQDALQLALSEINKDTFNMITVDGDTSTNDMVMVLANGTAGNSEIQSNQDSPWAIFYEGLHAVCTSLAKQIATDGEGATKLLKVEVHGAANKDDARTAARAVCLSPLVKTAMFGEDANWGRIASALGASGAAFTPERLSIYLQDMQLLAEGRPLPFDEAAAKIRLQENEITVIAYLNEGEEMATAYGCDLTYDYVKINASYRS